MENKKKKMIKSEFAKQVNDFSAKQPTFSLNKQEVNRENLEKQKNFIKKKLFKGYSKIHELKLVTIGLASPDKIKSWAEKELPNGKIFGEVTNANTFHYRTFKPSKGGLFCERIFGPIKDFECACGKRHRPTALESRKILEHEQTTRYFCPTCDVEYTWSIIRRYQLGYIKLNAPVVHLWYFQTNPSYLSILFDMKRKHLESIIYCTERITIENMWKSEQQNSKISRSPTDLYITWQKFFTLEEKIKKYQKVFERKQQKKRMFQKNFRELFLNEKKNQILSEKRNWLSIDVQNNKDFSKNPFLNDFNFVDQKKQEIFFNIQERKQKQIWSRTKKTFWKTIIQNSYKKTLKQIYLQNLFSQFFFPFNFKNQNELQSFQLKTHEQGFQKIFQIYLINNSQFSFTSFEKDNIEKTDCQKNILSFSYFQRLSTNKKNYLNMKNFSFSDEINDFSKFDVSKNEKFWNSLSFLFESGIFFISQKKKKSKDFQNLSKKDFLFLLNVLPFFQKIFLLKKKTKYSKLFNILSEEFSFLDGNKEDRMKLLFSKKFLQKKRATKKTQKKLVLQNKYFIEIVDYLNMLENFDNIFSSLKNYSELDFSFFLTNQKEVEKKQKFFPNSKKNLLSFFPDQTSNLRNEKKNEQFQKNVYFVLEKSPISFFVQQFLSHYFYLFFFLSQSQFLHLVNFQMKKYIKSFQSGQINEFFQKKKKLTFLISNKNFQIENIFQKKINMFFDERNEKFQFQETTTCFFISQFSFFYFFKMLSNSPKPKKFFEFSDSFFFFSNFSNIQKILKNQNKNYVRHIENYEFQGSQLNIKKDGGEKLRISIFNESESFQKKFKERKKQIQINQYLRVGFKYQNFEKFSRIRNEKVLFSKNEKVLFSKSKKVNTNKTEHVFRNSVYTIAYNYLWLNDSDWKYFVYYNSFFLHEFQDIPIPQYRFFSKASNNFLFKFGSQEGNFSLDDGQNPKLDDSFSSFFSSQLEAFHKNFFVGAGILEKFLGEYSSLELRKMTKQHQILLPKLNQAIRFLKQTAKTKKDSLKIQKYFQKREHIIRRFKFLRKFFRKNSNPSFMILRNLPVLPPDLRPILKLQNQIAASDLNRLYQRIIYRNDRLKKFSKDSATNQSFEIQYAQRLLQEAVDNLIQNGKGGVKAETNSRGQPLKSLSEVLKGKQGRFRQYLLGKRVDYSGRSVIVVGPQLKLYECGLPKEMALELFLPFLIQYILNSKLAKTVTGAKNLLKKDSTLTLHLLNKVMKNIPILLNRAPTLHRLGFQAFLPKLIKGRAILLHPMVCPAFNADFDGDQMAVHIPLTVEARTEAWKFMLSMNNLMNSATGEPIVLPSQDMVLGCYYLTSDFFAKPLGTQLANSLKQHAFFMFQDFLSCKQSFLFFQNFQEALAAYQRKEISLHTTVWVKWNSSVNFGNDISRPIEIRLKKTGFWESIQHKYMIFFDKKNHQFQKLIRTTPGRIIMNFMIQACIKGENEKNVIQNSIF